ncbi:hypothetical protein KSC_039780 [Ktedonobacter sp. SOSP1-52]|nr:hypothetical protein KSC_039780 [Ktedonobacter sp. SOSP1-52]
MRLPRIYASTKEDIRNCAIDFERVDTFVHEGNTLLPNFWAKLPNFDPAVKPKWGEDCAHQRRWLAENHVPPSDKENEDDSACQYILCYP